MILTNLGSLILSVKISSNHSQIPVARGFEFVSRGFIIFLNKVIS